MTIVLLAHPDFLAHQSMPRFVNMLARGMMKRGHHVEVWSPRPRCFDLTTLEALKKWLGYVDQYIIFPVEIRRKLARYGNDTLFVVTDQALGPWVPLVANRPHVIHCHDFLAQQSAFGFLPGHRTKWTGRLYQRLIRWGYSKGKYFISVSEKTRRDLHGFVKSQPIGSEVIYNGLNQRFVVHDADVSRRVMEQRSGVKLSNGYLLHVGGNQWYKNRVGLIKLYDAWREADHARLPLLMIGEPPSAFLLDAWTESRFKSDIHFLSNVSDEVIRFAYSGAVALIFPSFAEGFGWPIAEAMAAGCPVVTTDEEPMTEVAAATAFLISKCPPLNDVRINTWLANSAKIVSKVVALSPDQRRAVIDAGRRNANRFDVDATMDRVAATYRNILSKYHQP